MSPPSAQVTLSAEQLVLVAVARPKVDAEQAEKLRALIRGEWDWPRLRNLAWWHGLTPLLTRHLVDHCAELLTREQLDELTELSAQQARSAVFESAELVRVLECLTDAGIQAVPFKGPVLSVQLYGEAGLREFADLDVLCRPEDVARADELLTQAGYEAVVQLAHGLENYYMRSECDRAYFYPRTGTHLELHWAITPPYFSFSLSGRDLIDRAETVDLCGGAVRSFCAEDLLLVLCVNGAKEMWEKLEWVGAVSALVEKYPDLNWPKVEELATQTGGRRMLLIGLGLAQDICGLTLPPKMAASISADLNVQRLVGEAKAWLFAQHFESLRSEALTRFRLRARERQRDRWRYLLLRAITPTHRDLAAVRLPGSLHPLYYFVRPIRLIGSRLRGKTAA